MEDSTHPDGQPDLQGVWANNSVTPMTRPRQWKSRELLTDAEVSELKADVSRYVDQAGARADDAKAAAQPKTRPAR